MLSKLVQFESCEDTFYGTWKIKQEVLWKCEKFMELVKVIQSNMGENMYVLEVTEDKNTSNR